MSKRVTGPNNPVWLVFLVSVKHGIDFNERSIKNCWLKRENTERLMTLEIGQERWLLNNTVQCHKTWYVELWIIYNRFLTDGNIKYGFIFIQNKTRPDKTLSNSCKYEKKRSYVYFFMTRKCFTNNKTKNNNNFIPSCLG